MNADAVPSGNSGTLCCEDCGMVGGGGVGVGTMKGKVEALNVATVEIHQSLLGLVFGATHLGQAARREAAALARNAALMMPEFTTPPVTLPKLLAPMGMIWVPTLKAIWPEKT